MRTIFLDIDGVLNNQETFRNIESGCTTLKEVELKSLDDDLVKKFQRILKSTPDVKVVLSSSWRGSNESIKSIEEKVCELYDITPDIYDALRGEEIQRWLDRHPEVTRYAILDDDDDMLESQLPNFFKTNFDTGLTDEIADHVIKHFR